MPVESTDVDGFLLVGVLAASALGTRGVREIARRRQILDTPNDRSAHTRPTPRLGGIGIMAAFLPTFAAVSLGSDGDRVALVVLLATTMIAAVGLWDDLRPLPPRVRLAFQTLAAVAVVASAWGRVPAAWSLFGATVPHAVSAALSVLWIVWLTNLYNFMDGIDGLAAGQTVIAGVAIAFVAAAAGATVAAEGCALMAMAALGFLAFNFPPASIFMGDVGSTAIGFFFASTPFLRHREGFSVETVGIALALFILDATVTLLRRIARGERLSQAHRSHFYQRPLALGYRHRAITLVAYVGMIAVAALVQPFGGAALRDRLLLIAAAAAVFAGAASWVTSLEARAVPRASGE